MTIQKTTQIAREIAGLVVHLDLPLLNTERDTRTRIGYDRASGRVLRPAQTIVFGLVSVWKEMSVEVYHYDFPSPLLPLLPDPSHLQTPVAPLPPEDGDEAISTPTSNLPITSTRPNSSRR